MGAKNSPRATQNASKCQPFSKTRCTRHITIFGMPRKCKGTCSRHEQLSETDCGILYAEAESRYGPRPAVQAAVAAYCNIARKHGMTPTELAM
eukprot:scaffold97667_cov21-Tisochrysis_lutea.AAC.1